VTITGVLSHRSGHSERDQFVAKADTSGSKNDIQALGSTRSYGQRYTTIALLNIVTKGEDNDGQTAGQRPKPEVKAPAGFDDWWTDMVACADNGTKALEDAWTKSKPEYRKHVIATNKAGWEGLKRKARRCSREGLRLRQRSPEWHQARSASSRPLAPPT
jgi:hypothetical protein